MHKKWFSGPYYHPDGSGNSGVGDTTDDANLLAEGADSEDSDVDNTDDDDSDSDKEAETDSGGKKTTESDSIGDFTEGEEDDEQDEQQDEDQGEKDEKEEVDNEKEEDEEVEQEYTIRALKNAFPDIFKKFPEVKDAIFRERMYTRIYGSIEEAEEASYKARYLDEMSQDLAEGKSEGLLKALKKNNEESFKIFTAGFLPQLYKTDKDVYHEISDHMINQMLHVVNSNAVKNSNKNLATAVRYISQFCFGDPDLPELKELSKPREKTEKEIELERREQAHEQRRYDEFESGVHSRARVKLEQMVKDGFKDDKDMTDFVKDAITDRIIDKVGMIIAKDQFFQRQLASLWKKAGREGYTSEAKSRITSAYLARAKKIVPSVRAEVRKSASSRSIQNNNGSDNGKRQATSTGTGKKPKLPLDPKKIPSSMSDEDILASD